MAIEISNVVKFVPVSTTAKKDQPADGDPPIRGSKSRMGSKSYLEQQNMPDETNGLVADKEQKKLQGSVSLKELRDAADKGNTALQAVNRSLQFQVDDSTKEMVIKVVDKDTGKVVRQIPSDEALAYIKQLQELEGKHGAIIQGRA